MATNCKDLTNNKYQHNPPQMIWYGTEHNPVRLPRHSQQFSGKQNTQQWQLRNILSWRESNHHHYQPSKTTNIYQAPASLSPPQPSPGWQPIIIMLFVICCHHGYSYSFRSNFGQSIHYSYPIVCNIITIFTFTMISAWEVPLSSPSSQSSRSLSFRCHWTGKCFSTVRSTTRNTTGQASSINLNTKKYHCNWITFVFQE